MNYIFCLLFSLLTSAFSFAQSPMQTTVEYNGQKYPCYITEYNLPPEETQNVIQQKLKSQGYNADKSKGFLVYRNVRLKDLNSDEAQDFFFKIERKSRKEKDKSLVTMIAAKSGLILDGKVKGAATMANVGSAANSISFIKSFQSAMNLQQYNLEVAAQENEVAGAEKKLKSLLDEQEKLEKKIKDYQDDLEQNKKDQAKQDKEITKQKALLDQKKVEKPAE